MTPQLPSPDPVGEHLARSIGEASAAIARRRDLLGVGMLGNARQVIECLGRTGAMAGSRPEHDAGLSLAAEAGARLGVKAADFAFCSGHIAEFDDFSVTALAGGMLLVDPLEARIEVLRRACRFPGYFSFQRFPEWLAGAGWVDAMPARTAHDDFRGAVRENAIRVSGNLAEDLGRLGACIWALSWLRLFDLASDERTRPTLQERLDRVRCSLALPTGMHGSVDDAIRGFRRGAGNCPLCKIDGGAE